MLRSVDLLNVTVLHDDDTVGHGHGFGLVMGNIDEGGFQLYVNFGKLGTHLSTELGVQVGKGLVEKEDLRIADYGASEGNTLTLTARKSLRLTVEQVGNVENTGSLFNSALDFLLGNLAELKTEGHVAENGHVRIKSVVLEHHGDVAVLRSNVVYETVAYVELAFGDFFQTGDHTKGGGFTAAGGADQHQKFLIFDFEVKIRNSGNSAGIFLVNSSE